MAKLQELIKVYRDTPQELIPLCSIPEGAAWLGLPSTTVRAWVRGQSQGAKPDFERVVESDDALGGKLLSFRNLVEIHVLSLLRRDRGIRMEKVRETVAYLTNELGVAHPLASEEMFTLGKEILITRGDQLLSVPDKQLFSRPIVEEFMDRIEREDGHLMRLFPFSGERKPKAPRSVVIDPRVQFGRPCLAGTGIATWVIADRFNAGEQIPDIARDYRRTEEDVTEALRFEGKSRQAA